jgi:hypothetical protein
MEGEGELVFVTAIKLSTTGLTHEYIEKVRWLDCSNSTSNVMTVAQAVNFIRGGQQLQVADSAGAVSVGVVNADTPYIRTVADGRATDNLLALPRF